MLLIVLISNCLMAQTPSSGTIKSFKNFKSVYIDAKNIDVWLPPNYNPNKKYAVLYMHDGQMLFDSTTTWNKQEWQVDETLSTLFKEKNIKQCIVVGIYNNGKYRHSEYFPQEPLNLLPSSLKDSIIKDELQGKAQADNYLLFITKELKPFIDSTFKTYTNSKNTCIAGSSMGGLISMYAICQYPNIFGAAACLSTHWIGSAKRMNPLIPQAFNTYLQQHLSQLKNHKIYFDYGTVALDALYKVHQQNIDSTMQNAGFTQKNWITKEFVGADHSEKSWSKRLDIPLRFILTK